MRYFFAIVLFGFLCLRGASADIPNRKAVEQEIGAKVKALNAVYSEYHLEPIHFVPADLSAEELPSLRWPLATFWHIYIAPSTFIDCDSGTVRPYGFIREDLAANGTIYDKKPTPAWTPEKAASEAMPWINTFFGYLLPNLGSPQTQFTFDVYDKNQYYGGYWIIVWPRIDARGHLFEKDDLVVQISEKYGLTACALNFDSDYKVADGKVISKDEGISKADVIAPQLANKLFPGATLGSLKVDLYVVNLDNMLKITDLHQWKAERNARLAWLVEYPLISSSPLPYHTIAIKIDAFTGEVLGGNP